MSSDSSIRPSDEEPNIQPTPPPRYEAWDRGDERRELSDDQRRRPISPASRSMFGFLEVTYPWRPRFPESAVWGMVYFAVAFMAVVFFWIFAQLLPALVVFIGLVVVNCLRFGADKALSPQGAQLLQQQSVAPILIAGHLVAIPSVLLFLRLILGPDWLRRLAVRLPGWWHLLLTVLFIPALILLANGVFSVAKHFLPNFGELLQRVFHFSKDAGSMEGMEQIVKLFGTWPWWLAVLVVGLGPALSEELWCRGLLGLGVLGRNGVAARLLFSAFYFGVLHVDPQQGTMAAVLGLVLYFVLLTTRCFWMPVLIHFGINSTSVIAAHFETASAIDQRPEDIPLLLYLGAFVLFVTIAVSLYRTRARLANTLGGDGPLLWQPTYAGLEHPPANSGVVVSRPQPTLIDLGLLALGLATFGAAVTCVLIFA